MNVGKTLFAQVMEFVPWMVVHTRARELLQWMMPQLAAFPREHRHTVTDHMAGLVLQLHDALVAARHLEPADRARTLLDADVRLDQLRQYLHMAWHWRWLSNGQYEHVSRQTDELGRLIGGWRRSQGRNPDRGKTAPADAKSEHIAAERRAAPETDSERGPI